MKPLISLEPTLTEYLRKKTQSSKQQVKDLGYIINMGSRQLSPDRKLAILSLSTPQRLRNISVPF